MDRKVSICYSKDGGHTWSDWKERSLGEIGEYRKRVKVGPLGHAMSFIIKVRVTSPIKRDLLAMTAVVERKE